MAAPSRLPRRLPRRLRTWAGAVRAGARADPATVVVGGLIALAGLVVLGPALVGHGMLFDVNLLSSRLPFRTVAGRETADVITCRTDTTDYLPGLHTIVDAVRHGRYPTWSPYEVGGSTLAGTPNYSWLTPLSWPFWVLPLWLAPAYVKLTECVVAVTGMVLLLRRWGVSRAGSLLAGFCFVTCGFMIMWSNWPHTRTAALVPLLFWAVDRIVTRPRPVDAAILAVVLASMLLGGFPAVTLYAGTLVAVYAVSRLWMLHRWAVRPLVGALTAGLGGVVLGLALAAVQLLPFAEQLGLALADREKTSAQLPLGAALTLAAPFVRGDCVDGRRFGDVIPIEAVGYAGVGTLVLVVVGVLLAGRGRPADQGTGETVDGTATGLHRWLVAAFLGCALLLWVGGPALQLLRTLPLFGSNSFSRAQSLTGFLLAALAGVGLDLVLRHRLRPAPSPPAAGGEVSRRRLVGVLAVVGALAVVVLVAQLSDAARDDYLGDTLRATIGPLLLLLVAGSAATLVLASRKLEVRRVAALVLVAATVVQGAAFAHRMLPTSDRAYLYPETTTHRFLQQVVGRDRYGAGDATMEPTTSDWYRLRTPVGHEFTPQRWKDVLEAVDPDVMRTSTYSAFSPELSFADVQRSAVLDRLAVRWWVLSPGHPAGALEEPPEGDDPVTLVGGAPLTCRIAGGPLRGVGVRVTAPLTASAPGARPMLQVRVRQGDQVRTGAILLDTAAPAGDRWISVAGEDLPPSTAEARVSLRLTGTRVPLELGGTDGRPDCGAVRPLAGDGVRLAHADAGGAVYERLDALPRIRWAGRGRVVPPEDQVAALERGVPRGTVLLDDDSTPSGSGRRADLDVRADDPERIRVRVDAAGAGYLVVADSIARPGWTATVDGRPTRLVAADHALAAVPVPAGTHDVELRYAAPGLRVGATVSGVALLVLLLLCVPPTRRAAWVSLVRRSGTRRRPPARQ